MGPDALSAPQGLDTSPLNFIYACSVCCATFADAYEGHNETVQGFSDGINPKDRLVTKLFLGDCCHVFCGQHLEGGGPPFHPAGQKPKAPCPVCVRDKDDSSLRELYSIRGFNKDEYDPALSSIWFTVPPISLDGNSKEENALRFHYLALIGYCQNTYRTRKSAAKALVDAKSELATTQKRNAEEHAKIVTLQQENDRLRDALEQTAEMDSLRAEVQRLQRLEQEVDQFNMDVEAFRRLKADVRDLDTFRQNKPSILHYLKLLPKIVEQNRKMRYRLATLGFAMAVEPIPNHAQLTSAEFDDIQSIADAYAGDDREFQRSSSSHTAGRSAHTSGNEAAKHALESSERPQKRPRMESPVQRKIRNHQPGSRDAMPPPVKPVSRMGSVRALIPTIRKKLSSVRHSPAPKDRRLNNGDVQMYDSGHWRNAAGPRSDHKRHAIYMETPYMTGALPVEPASGGSNLFGSVGLHGNASEFSFRASSPVKMVSQPEQHQPVRLPTEPSYLRLMDGLSQDDGLELSIRDPRQQPLMQHHDQYQTPKSNSQKRWNLGHAFLHQSPRAAPEMTEQHQNTSPANRTNAFFTREQYDARQVPVTPAPGRHQQRGPPIENVVSSFFGRSHHDAFETPQSRITETQTSSRHFGAYQSPEIPPSRKATGWHEHCNLNGLSFMNTPLDAHNEPIRHDHRSQASRNASFYPHGPQYSDPHRSPVRQETNPFFFSEPSSHRSPIHNRPVFSRNLQAVTSVPASNRASSSRVRQLPSTMPSTLSSRSPLRSRTQGEYLQHAGVGSVRQPRSRILGSSFDPSYTNAYPRYERRSVRR